MGWFELSPSHISVVAQSLRSVLRRGGKGQRSEPHRFPDSALSTEVVPHLSPAKRESAGDVTR